MQSLLTLTLTLTLTLAESKRHAVSPNTNSNSNTHLGRVQEACSLSRDRHLVRAGGGAAAPALGARALCGRNEVNAGTEIDLVHRLREGRFPARKENELVEHNTVKVPHAAGGT